MKTGIKENVKTNTKIKYYIFHKHQKEKEDRCRDFTNLELHVLTSHTVFIEPAGFSNDRRKNKK